MHRIVSHTMRVTGALVRLCATGCDARQMQAWLIRKTLQTSQHRSADRATPAFAHHAYWHVTSYEKQAKRYEQQGRLCEGAPSGRLACRTGGYLVNFCLASEEDEHIPSGFIEVNMHGSVHSSCQVVLCMVLLAVHYLNIKGAPRHSEHRTVVEVGTELLPV